jgi:hypothetical protein
MKRRDRARHTAPSAPPEVAPLPGASAPLAVAAAAVLILVLAWAARGNLNVDGVAYLELAHRLGRGDWSGFVQGYWSPLYPAILAPVLALGGLAGAGAIAAAHAVNAAIALAAIGLLYRTPWLRRHPVWLLFALTAFLVASARTVRVDAVTPDLLLLLATLGLGLELLRAEGWRGGAVGAWASVAFLAKTSTWPWLLVIGVAGWLVAWRGERPRAMALATAIVAVPVLCWSLLVAREPGRASLASAGQLNACWYLFTCDGRTPDSHRG